AKAAADLEAVDSRQADVEHDEPHRPPRELLETGLAGPHPGHLVAIPNEVCLNQIGNRLLVLDEENVAFHVPNFSQREAAGPRADRHAAAVDSRPAIC